MTNIWRLTKVQLLSSFGLNKALHSRDTKERRKMMLISIGILLGMIMIAAASFGYSYGMAMLFEQMGRTEMLLAVMMTVTSLIGFFTTVYKAGSILFSFKDYDLIMSLPIKTSHVVASRVLQLYVLNLFFTLIVMVPAGAVYAIKVNPSVLYYLFFILSLLFIPLIPIIAATIIGALISWISSRFRSSRVISLILTFAAIIAFMTGSFFLGGTEPQAQLLTDMGEQLADMIYQLYPLAQLYVDAVSSYQIASLLLFVSLSALCFVLFTALLGTRFKAIHTGLTTSHTSRNYKKKSLQASSPFLALYRKELRRFLSSSLYVLNSSIGMVLLLVMSVALLFVGSDTLGQALEIPQLSNYLGRLSPLVVSLFVAMSCSTSSSISLEGNHLWILKSSPVPKQTVLMSKIAVNLTITVPILIISSVILMFSLRLGWMETILLFVVPVLYALFTAAWGVLMNLKFPNFEWTSETTVIKQGVAVLGSMLVNFISLIIPFVVSLLLPDVDGNLILLGYAVILMAVCSVLYQYIHTKGERMFQAL